MPVSSAAVQLTATVNPIAAWLDVVTSAFENTVGIGGEWLSDPAPILQQFIRNQLGYGETAIAAGQGVIEAFIEYVSPANPSGLVANLQTAFEELTSGDISGAFETLGQALVLLPVLNVGLPLLTSGLLEIPATMAQNFANVVATLTDVNGALPIALGGLGSVLGPINAIGDSIQTVVDAFGAGDPISAVGAALSAPAVIVGALLNGYTNLAGTEFPGLLTVGDNPFNSGLIQSLLVNLPRAIADAIAPEAEPEALTTEETQTLAATGDPGNPSTGSGELVAVSNASVAEEDAGEDAEGAENSAEDAEGADGEGAGEDAKDADEDGEPADADTEGADTEGAPEASDEESGADDGSTDLSDGNKATPGDTGGEDAGADDPSDNADTSTGAGDTDGDGSDGDGSGDSGSGDSGSGDSGSGDSE